MKKIQKRRIGPMTIAAPFFALAIVLAYILGINAEYAAGFANGQHAGQHASYVAGEANAMRVLYNTSTTSCAHDLQGYTVSKFALDETGHIQFTCKSR